MSYLPVLTSIFPSSSLGNRMLCSFNLFATGGPLTCWMWTSSKKTIWVDFRDGSCSLSYQDDSCLISTSSLFKITNNMEKVKRFKLLSLFTSLHLILHLLFSLWKSVENDKPLLQFSIHFLFLLYLIICNLLYSLIFIYFRLGSPKG